MEKCLIVVNKQYVQSAKITPKTNKLFKQQEKIKESDLIELTGHIVLDLVDTASIMDTLQETALTHNIDPQTLNYYLIKERNLIVENPLYILDEIYQDKNGIAETTIIAGSYDPDILLKKRHEFVLRDPYGIISKNGIAEETDTHFSTNFENGILEYNIYTIPIY